MHKIKTFKGRLCVPSLIDKYDEVKCILPLANSIICKLSFTALISIAANVRTFRKLKFIKNHLRSTISLIG